jgi:hypothetical protein
MTIATVAERREGRYLELEKMIGVSRPRHEENRGQTESLTLVFDRALERFPTVILDTWRSFGVVALMAPAFGPLARYQALKAGFYLIVQVGGHSLQDGAQILLDPENRCWMTHCGLGGLLKSWEKGDRDLAAYLAVAYENDCLMAYLPDVLGFALDPTVKRF